ncbi:conserved hypothetical protein [Pediculus humanus corporis]|uniref:Uncharacterized protein n=1 Tax=Pediculus humanus subsp. corporis TaxID=121224 RepID=E0VT96_PEDHC|nr:uncharacterized protein Phum_PHUM429670 [Pediculus humanus corporis]EEB16602.1 conserved hypothetical protein [Pediculus humanus corporis]
MSDSDQKTFSKNFMEVLNKISDSKIKSIDNTQLDKLVSHINLEFDLKPNDYLELPGLSIWLLETIKLWKFQNPKIHTATFLCHFIGILSKHCKGFEFIQKDEILNELLATVEPILLNNDLLKLAIIKLFRNVQKSIEFLNEFLKSTDGDSIVGQMLQEILSLQFESIDLTYIVSSVYILHLITKILVDNNKCSENEVLLIILKVFENLLTKNRFICIINLGKFCQLQFDEIKTKFNSNTSVQLYLAVLQLVPLLSYKCSPENEIFEKTIEKFFNFFIPDCKIYINSFGNKIQTHENLKNLAVRGLLNVCSNLQCLDLREVTVLLNFLVFVLNMFFYDEINFQCFDEPVNKKFKKELHNPADDISVISAIIKSLSLLIEKFNVNKVEFKDNFDLIKLTSQLLQNEKLSSVVIVDTLSLVKRIIVNIASVNNSSLIDIIEEKNFFTLIKSVINGDIESYVRASAIRALSALLKINKIRFSVNLLNLSSEIIVLIQRETEGIVRQEGVLLLKQIYSYFNEGTKQLKVFFETMSYLAICDLHWEVKINALLFWEAAIIKVLVAHGIPVDSEKKKNINISDESIIETLYNALNQLSKIGCLYVLLSTLINDCDFQVVQISAKITSNLLDILKSYCNLNKLINFNESQNSHECTSENTNLNLLFENTDVNNFNMETRNDHIEKTISNSEAVIDEIVKEGDLSLLVNIQKNCKSDQSYTNKILLQELKPEKFLKMLQNFHYNEFLNEKKKWWNIHMDVNSLLEDIIKSNTECEANTLDCY